MKPRKNILYLTYDGLTDPLGQSQVLPYLLALSKLGFSFHIVSFEKPAAFKKEEPTVRHLLQGKAIVWHPQTYHKKPPILSAVYDVLNMWRVAKQLQKQHRFHKCWCRSYLPALVGARLKTRFNLPFLFDMRGFWPDERVEGGSWPLSHPVYRQVYQYFKKREKQLLVEADHVVVLTEKAKNILLRGELQGVVPTSVSVVPCCVDADHFNPDNVAEAGKQLKRKELGLAEEDKILVYAGSLGSWYLVGEMLEYFSRLRNTDNTWKFLLVTQDDPKPALGKATLAGIPPDAIKIASASRSEMPVYLSLARLAISFIMPVFSKQASSPTKLAEYMAMGLPVVCNKGVGDVDEILEKYGAGQLIDISHTYKIQFSTAKSEQEIRNVALSLFSLQKGVGVYCELLP